MGRLSVQDGDAFWDVPEREIVFERGAEANRVILEMKKRLIARASSNSDGGPSHVRIRVRFLSDLDERRELSARDVMQGTPVEVPKDAGGAILEATSLGYSSTPKPVDLTVPNPQIEEDLTLEPVRLPVVVKVKPRLDDCPFLADVQVNVETESLTLARRIVEDQLVLESVGGNGLTVEDDDVTFGVGGACLRVLEGTQPVRVTEADLEAGKLERELQLVYGKPAMVVAVAAERLWSTLVSPSETLTLLRFQESVFNVFHHVASQSPSPWGRFEILLIGDGGRVRDESVLHDCAVRASELPPWNESVRDRLVRRTILDCDTMEIPLNLILDSIVDHMGPLSLGQGAVDIVIVQAGIPRLLPVSEEDSARWRDSFGSSARVTVVSFSDTGGRAAQVEGPLREALGGEARVRVEGKNLLALLSEADFANNTYHEFDYLFTARRSD